MRLNGLSALSVLADQHKAEVAAQAAIAAQRALETRISVMSSEHTVPQLRAMAESMLITLPSKARKSEIIDLIIAKEDRLAKESVTDATKTPAKPAVIIYSLVGMMNSTVRTHSNGSASTFLTKRSNNKANLYVSMSPAMVARIRRRLDENKLRLDAPVQILGHYVQSTTFNKEGIRHPDSFRLTGIRNATEEVINDIAQHIVRVES